MSRCKTCQCSPCRCDMFAEQRPPMSNAPATWGTARPIHSDAMAVHPDQVQAVMERNKKHGLGHIKYDTEGRPILTDRAMRRDLMRLEGLHDREGGYGDDHATVSPQAPIDPETSGGDLALEALGDNVREGKNPYHDLSLAGPVEASAMAVHRARSGKPA